MGLPCEVLPTMVIQEVEGSGSLHFGKSGVEGTREWQVPWNNPATGQDYISFVQQLLGLNLPGPNGIPAVTKPDVYSQDFPWLFCQDLSVKGHVPCGTDVWGRIRYRYAKVTAKYLPYEMGESFHLAAQFLSFKENSFAWAGAYVPPPPMPQFVPVVDNVGREVQGLNQAVAAGNKKLPDLRTKEDTLSKQLHDIAQQYNVNFNDLVQLENAAVFDAALAEVLRGATLGFPPDQAGEFVLNLTRQINQYNDVGRQIDELNNQIIQWQAAANALPQENQQKFNQWQADVQNWLIAYSPLAQGIDESNFQSRAIKDGKTDGVSVPVGKVIPLGEYTVQRHLVLLPDFQSWIMCLGCVNAYYFLGFPPWTLLFHGLDGKRINMPNGSRAWDVTLKFLFNPNGHNMLYRADRGNWQVIVSVSPSSFQPPWGAGQFAPNVPAGGQQPAAGPDTVTGTANGTTRITGLSIPTDDGWAGGTVTGPGIPPGTLVTVVGPGDAITLSNPVQGSGPVAMTFAQTVTTGDVTVGSNVISNVQITHTLGIGQQVVGANIPQGATIVGLLGNDAVQISDNATGTAVQENLTFVEVNATGTANGTPTITGLNPQANGVGVGSGQTVTGAGVPPNTIVLKVEPNQTTLSLSQNVTATGEVTFTITAFQNALHKYLYNPVDFGIFLNYN